MRALFRGLMVPVSFVLFLALFAATAAAVIALGPILLDGLKPEALATLVPTGGGKPSPYVIAAGVAAVDALLIGMIAMLVSEKVFTVGRFVRSLVKTAIWFAILTAGPLAIWLHGQEGPSGWTRYAPAILLAAGLIAAAIVTGLILGKPFLWWVSERPPEMRRRQTAVEVVPAPIAAQHQATPQPIPLPAVAMAAEPSADAVAPATSPAPAEAPRS